MIRQATSCDICGTEKKQTNHWFVAYDQSGELRLSGWNSRNRQRAGSKHLCGQTCLHKLVDDFMARCLAVRAQPGGAEQTIAEAPVAAPAAHTDASLTSDLAYGETESSARLITTPVAVSPPILLPAELVANAQRMQTGEFLPAAGEPPRYASRNWRAEAWDRERERALHAVERRPEPAARRRSGN